MPKEVVIYADESDQKGPHFGDFYGGALVRSTDLEEAVSQLEAAKRDLNLHAEVKWQKVTAQYLQKYIQLMNVFFDLVAEDRVKVRIMFTSAQHAATGLTAYHRQNRYHLLYYQFIKHAFGLQFANQPARSLRVRCYLDRLPGTGKRNRQFKSFLSALEDNPAFRAAQIAIPADQIAEVRSHDHVLMQSLDVVLGAMQFRLNDKHRHKPAGARRRAKKTIAKEKLYKHISTRIRQIYPNFNIGVSTGTHGDAAARWHHPYRHWCFSPANARVDRSKGKRIEKPRCRYALRRIAGGTCDFATSRVISR